MFRTASNPAFHSPDPDADTLESLEGAASDPAFTAAWRAFARACAARVRPAVPASLRDQAEAWARAADAYERGELDDAGLTEARVRAWRAHNGVRAAASGAELAAVRAAMHRLWPGPDAAQWYESAAHFREVCVEAGLAPGEWRAILGEHLASYLPGGGRRAESGAPAG